VDSGIAAAIDPDDSLPELNNFKDSWDPWEATDMPVFFHIPKSGGSTIKDIMGTCHRFVLASEAGVTDGHDQDTVSICTVTPLFLYFKHFYSQQSLCDLIGNSNCLSKGWCSWSITQSIRKHRCDNCRRNSKSKRYGICGFWSW
jgi:hypothetical protein